MLSAGLPKSPQVGTGMYANGCDLLMCNVQITCCELCRPQWEAADLTKGTAARRKWCCAAATAPSEGRPRSERQCIMQFAEAPAVAPTLERQHVGRPRMLVALLLMQASQACIPHAGSVESWQPWQPPRVAPFLPASVQPDAARAQPRVHQMDTCSGCCSTPPPRAVTFPGHCILDSCNGRHVQL